MVTRIPLLAFLLTVCTAISGFAQLPIMGADVSFLQQIEDNHGVFKDHGVPMDCLQILKNHGINCIRLRLWYNPETPYNGLEKTLAIAARIKQLNMKFLLDFHYSDTWADPGYQTKPAAWAGLSINQLTDSMYGYTKTVTAAMKAQNTLPEIVQIGNEITCGMLWPDGRVCDSYNTPEHWQNLGNFIKQAIRGVNENLSPGDSVKIMIHVDQSTDSSWAEWFYDNLFAQGVNFDIIGLSYYTIWQGDFSRLGPTMNSLARRYDKDIIVAEYAYPWSLGWDDTTHNFFGLESQLQPGYPATVAGQFAFMTDLMTKIKNIPNGHGKGMIYFEPDFITSPTFGSDRENVTWFDFNGEALPSMRVFEPVHVPSSPPPFMIGADVSFLKEIQDHGGIYKDHGVAKDLVKIFSDHGMNYIRIRLCHCPANWNDGLPKALWLAQKAKQNNMKILLDMHYSQNWADPGTQNIPPEWVGLPYATLRDSVYQYTYSVMQAFNAQNTLPEMVQLGNEITYGMLFPVCQVSGSYDTPAQWQQFAGVLRSAQQAIYDFVPPPDIDGNRIVRIMIHIDRSGDSSGAKYFFDNLLSQGFNFDVIGLSYYSYWHTRDLNTLTANLNMLANRYHKDIVIAETTYPWTLDSCDNVHNEMNSMNQLIDGIPPTIAGQTLYHTTLMNILKNVPEHRGIGMFFWEPDRISTASLPCDHENLALFDFQGNLLPSVQPFEPIMNTHLEPGWNMVSLPLAVWNTAPDFLFPVHNGSIYGFRNGYAGMDTLTDRTGYWIKSTPDILVPVQGATISNDTIPVQNRWNMIGAFSVPVAVNRLSGVDPVSIISNVFSYSQSLGYGTADTLQPGKAYWIKASHMGKLIVR